MWGKLWDLNHIFDSLLGTLFHNCESHRAIWFIQEPSWDLWWEERKAGHGFLHTLSGIAVTYGWIRGPLPQLLRVQGCFQVSPGMRRRWRGWETFPEKKSSFCRRRLRSVRHKWKEADRSPLTLLGAQGWDRPSRRRGCPCQHLPSPPLANQPALLQRQILVPALPQIWALLFILSKISAAPPPSMLWEDERSSPA